MCICEGHDDRRNSSSTILPGMWIEEAIGILDPDVPRSIINRGCSLLLWVGAVNVQVTSWDENYYSRLVKKLIHNAQASIDRDAYVVVLPVLLPPRETSNWRQNAKSLNNLLELECYGRYK